MGSIHFRQRSKRCLLRIDVLGRRTGRWPLGENWPFSDREFDCAEGKDLESARRDLGHLTAMLEAGRGDEVLVDPRTGKPFVTPNLDGSDPTDLTNR